MHLKEERIRVTPTTNSETVPLGAEAISSPYTATPPQPCPLPDTTCDILEVYPDPELALRLWAIYVKSVDPVLKILHIPTAQSSVIATILNPKAAGRSMIALTYAICFAAITALEDGAEEIDLPLGKTGLLKRYRVPLERLLIDKDVMDRPEMTALQALAIYVVSSFAMQRGMMQALTLPASDLFTGGGKWPKHMDPHWVGNKTRPVYRITS
jgi:hypothetical protein